MPMQKIGSMSLKNQGGFVARIQFAYIDDDGHKNLTGQTSDITLGRTKTVDPSDLKVPDGVMIYMYVFVLWGRDNEATQAFVYEKGNPSTAEYVISGTTLANTLGLVKVT